MPAAEAKVEDRSSFISTSQLRLRKRHFRSLAPWAFLVGTWKVGFLILLCKSLSGRRELLAEFGWEVTRR